MDEPCMYKRVDKKATDYLILYIDGILLIENDVGVLSMVKMWLAT